MTIRLEIVTPEKAVFSEDVDEVIVPGTEGEMGILPGHLPLMTMLGSGRLIAVMKGERHRFAVHGGFAEILPNKVVILTDASESATDIDVDRARAAIEKAEKALQTAEAKRDDDDSEADPAALHRAALARARARLIVSEDGE